MANIRELLEATLAKRRPVAAHVEQVIRQLGEATSAISVLQRTLDKEQPGHPASGTASALVSEAEQLSRQLNTVRQRFARNSLNIGVIGRARQGKSRLLQSITGLSSAEIPDGNRQHCTGVRSVITHQKTGATYGDVYFYTEAQFLDAVIQPYFTALNLGNPPLTLQEFAGSLPPPSDSATTADYRAKYQHLKKYHERLAHYQHLLQERSPRRISHAQIPEFVAQHLLGDANHPLYNYLAVREVLIYCTFPHDAVEQVAAIDMPGLGDTGVGDETRMIQALGELVDLVLYVRLPKATGDHWADVDVQLYDTAARALPEIPMEQRAFMVLNQLADGSNAANCRDLQDSLQQHHLRVARAVTANCADPEQVSHKQHLSLLPRY